MAHRQVHARTPSAGVCGRPKVFMVSVDWNRELVEQLASHWAHQLRPRLRGLTDEEYFWQPVPDCWTIRRRGTSSAAISWGAGEFTMDFDESPREQEPVTTIA